MKNDIKKTLACLGLAGTVISGAPMGAYANMVPHRAIYALTLNSEKEENALDAANGRWVLEVDGADCVGYDITYRFMARLMHTDGTTEVLDQRGISYEDPEGKAFNFSNQTYMNNALVEDVKGIASKKDGRLEVTLSKPENKTVELPETTIFPSHHYREIIAAAKRGETFLSDEVYEGVEQGVEPFQITAIIGKAIEPEKGQQGTARAELEAEGLVSWPVTLAYFNMEMQGDAKPIWQSSFTLYENGVSRDFKLDYDYFSLNAELTKIEYLEGESCK